MPAPEGMLTSVESGLLQARTVDSTIMGFIYLPEAPMIVAARPVLYSTGEGPVGGTFVMGAWFDEAYVADLADKTELSVTAFDPFDRNLPGDIQSAIAALAGDQDTVIQPLDRDTIAGYSLIRDLEGEPAAVLRVALPRSIHAQGLRTVRYITLFLTVVGTITSLASVALIDRHVLTRLLRLMSEVKDIAGRSDPSLRVTTHGRDELSILAAEINQMLRALEQSQSDLARSEAQNRAILQAIPDTMIRVHQDGTILSFAVPDGGTLPLHSSDFVGKKLPELMAALAPLMSEETGQRVLSLMPRALENGHAQIGFQLEAGGRQDYEARVVPSGDNEVLAIIRDVTDRNLAEEAERRGLLLKEIHHRVKNNLQVIASLLNLQARRIGDPQTVIMLRDTRDRVRSMGLIHEKLYQSQDLVGINFDEYVHELVTSLFKSQGTHDGLVRPRVAIDKCFLNMETAIPCGLIINELVSNALKHAFPAGQGGEITVEMHTVPDDKFVLTVRDNGVGLPPSVDPFQTLSLGLQLVTTLTQQLDGTIEVVQNNGATFRITFAQQGVIKARQNGNVEHTDR
jgi:two-component sensor histidine kinase/HAMP domain-containing protein